MALDPIYVNFNVNEQDVLRIREDARKRGITPNEIRQLPVEIGLQTETGYPHKGKLDYVSPSMNRPPARSRCAAYCRIPIAYCCPASSCASACL